MTPNSLYAKMAAIMAAIPGLGKDKQMTGGRLNYKYVSDAQVYMTVRKLLIEHKIALLASMTGSHQERYELGEYNGKPQDKFHTRAQFEFILVDSETGDQVACTWESESEDSSDKGLNKCATAALKYWLLKTFLIPTGDDPDMFAGDDDEDPPQNAPQSRQKPPQRAGTSQRTPAPAQNENAAQDALSEHFGPKLNDKAKLSTNIPGVVDWVIWRSGFEGQSASYHGEGRLFLACGGEYIKGANGRMKIDWRKIDPEMTIGEAKDLVEKRIAEQDAEEETISGKLNRSAKDIAALLD